MLALRLAAPQTERVAAADAPRRSSPASRPSHSSPTQASLAILSVAIASRREEHMIQKQPRTPEKRPSGRSLDRAVQWDSGIFSAISSGALDPTGPSDGGVPPLPSRGTTPRRTLPTSSRGRAGPPLPADTK